jgi:DUF305 family protein family protein
MTVTRFGHSARESSAAHSPMHLCRRWLGPAAVLAVGIASLAWAQQPEPAAPPLPCGATASALSEEAPFLAENERAMTKMMADMSVRPTGDVDHDFVEMMVPHHQGAIEMARALLRHGHNEALRRIAQEIIVTQQQEIAAMRLALGEPLPPSAAAPDQPSDLSAPSPAPRPVMHMQKEP